MRIFKTAFINYDRFIFLLREFLLKRTIFSIIGGMNGDVKNRHYANIIEDNSLTPFLWGDFCLVLSPFVVPRHRGKMSNKQHDNTEGVELLRERVFIRQNS